MRVYKPTTTFTKQNTKEKLVFVREGLLYGLVIQKAKIDKVSLNRGITSTPTVVFYDNNTKCLIDYSNQTNKDIEPKLKEYFSQIESGTTLYLYNGIYTDPNTNITADLTGQYVFRSYYNGIVEADVTSVNSLSTQINRYDKTRFEEIPYLVSNTLVEGSDTKTIIKNKLGKNTKNSFNYLGIKQGDFIKITDYSSQLQVLDISIDSDGNEYIVVDKNIDDMDMTNLKTKIDVFIPVIDTYITPPDPSETATGSCVEYANGIVISCTDNHTISQCRFRSSPIRGIKTEITLNRFCTTPETSTAVQRENADNLTMLTNTLASLVSNMNSSVSGVVNKSGNSTNTFYGRPF